MLVTPYRVWARAAGEDVSVWMKQLNKSWVANGPKKSSEDAVYDVALDTEADMGEYGMISVLMMDDLEKGFEKVKHAELRSKAEVYCFPPTPLKMALSMYTAQRRIRCWGAYSRAAVSEIGVLAGCPVAMGFSCWPISTLLQDSGAVCPHTLRSQLPTSKCTLTAS